MISRNMLLLFGVLLLQGLAYADDAASVTEKDTEITIGEKRFVLVKQLERFDDALGKCKKREEGGLLAMPKTVQIQRELYGFLKQQFSDTNSRHVWIGGTDKAMEAKWRWADADKECITDTYFNNLRLTTFLQRQDMDCLTINTGTRASRWSWEDKNCEDYYYYVCEFNKADTQQKADSDSQQQS